MVRSIVIQPMQYLEKAKERKEDYLFLWISPSSSGDSGDVAVAARTLLSCVHPTLHTGKATVECIQVLASRLMTNAK